MSYKDQATPAKNFAVWLNKSFADEAAEILKDDAEARGLDKESIHDLVVRDHPTFSNMVVVSAKFKEKDNGK